MVAGLPPLRGRSAIAHLGVLKHQPDLIDALEADVAAMMSAADRFGVDLDPLGKALLACGCHSTSGDSSELVRSIFLARKGQLMATLPVSTWALCEDGASPRVASSASVRALAVASSLAACCRSRASSRRRWACREGLKALGFLRPGL